jgi:hypothetical protein
MPSILTVTAKDEIITSPSAPHDDIPYRVIPDLIRNLFLKQIDRETIAFGKERITGSY